MGLVVGAAVIKAAASEYCRNKSYYHDVVRFNVANGIKNNKEYRTLNYWDLPREVRDKIQRLYGGRYKGMKISSIYRSLGMRATNTNNSMPLESKYAYAYYKRYGSFAYNPQNKISDYEVLRVLSASEEDEISRLF